MSFFFFSSSSSSSSSSPSLFLACGSLGFFFFLPLPFPLPILLAGGLLGGEGLWVSFFFFNFFRKFRFLKEKIKKLFYLPRGRHLAATSAFNRSMNGKCNGCIILK